ncbi:hypothetical protein QOZ80_2BG0187820 [Eleusine coracana subsp. coracana]|nr:hypothetical protein QOZ80_2BG0187820 [Eleusine coracana subsp. coracana]
MMENRRQRATRRLRCLLALAGDYLKYLFMRRRRLVHKVARKTLALVHYHHHKNNPWPCAITEHEFSCADSPSPAFLAAKRLLLRSRLRKSSDAGVVMSSCCFGSFILAPPPFGSWHETTMAPSEAAEESTEEEEDVETTDDDEEEEDQGDDEEDGWLQYGGEMVDDVDDRAEEFINMFYQQLRAQSFAAVFHQGSSP